MLEPILNNTRITGEICIYLNIDIIHSAPIGFTVLSCEELQYPGLAAPTTIPRTPPL